MFTINTDNNITFYETDAAAQAANNEGAQAFSSQKELSKLTAGWPTSRLVEVWNSFAGTPGPFEKLKEVKKFTDRKTAINRIWGVIQVLAGPVGASAPAPVDVAAPAKAKEKPVKASKPAKAAKAPTPVEERAPREGTAKSKVIAMLERKGGATLSKIMKETGWQAHTTRGFISILGSKGGLKINSSRRESDKARVYEIEK